MITAGDEFGRTQQGNNNAYCQDNAITWLDWAKADLDLAAFTAALVRLRARLALFGADAPLEGAAREGRHHPDALWLRLDGSPKQASDWVDGDCLVLLTAVEHGGETQRAIFAFNRAFEPRSLMLPEPWTGRSWRCALDSATGQCAPDMPAVHTLNARAVCVLVEER
jgi:glycogen operon protein